MTPEIYLDANATCAVLPAAIAAAAAAMRANYGNPSSSHASGLRAKAMLECVRMRARAAIGADAGQLIFTSGATEAIQAAIVSALCAIRERRQGGAALADLLLYGATEHKAVPESLAHWNRLLGTGLELRALPVDEGGRHRLDVLRELAPRAALVCTMAANNETGVVSDLAAIEAVLQDTASPAYWLVDSVQALGKLELNLGATRIDYAPFSGHKLHAPKGVGMLYVREGAPCTPLMAGGGQEAGQRSGTENMAGIAALGAVLAALGDGSTFRPLAQLAQFRARMAQALRDALPGVVFNAPFETALPTTLNFAVPGLAGKELLDLFDAAGVRVSAGSACSAAQAAPSHVLAAMNLPQWRCTGAVRMSFSPLADEAFIDAVCRRIAWCGAALRSGAMLASSLPPARDDGVVQLCFDGACCYLVFDAASRSCAVIDPVEPLAGRIAALVRAQGSRLRAVVQTRIDDGIAGARAALMAQHPALQAGVDALGWPHDAGAVGLADGSEAPALALGATILARVARETSRAGAQHGAQDSASYLCGTRAPGAGTLEVRFAFTGRDAFDSRWADALVCGAHDSGDLACATGAGRGAAPAPMELDAGALARFLLAHPDALLVDVREAYEHAAGGAGDAWPGRAVRSVPLSRLVGQLSGWLRGEQRPLVFFCRSGSRSARAARCLQRLGHRSAWHLAGGLALCAGADGKGDTEAAPLAA